MSAPADPELRRHAPPYVVPFAIFMAGLLVTELLAWLGGENAPFLLRESKYWVYPLQTLLCAAALIFYWRRYDFGPQRVLLLAAGIGVAVFAIWISPQALLGFPPRTDGFNPAVFADDPALYWGTVLARFLRLVIIVPLVEEIFWRGFLQRFLVDERFTAVPFGKYTHLSFWAVVVAFTMAHHQADWPAAFLTGAIYGWVAIKTKSLLACVLAHAVTNLLLGLYIMQTGQWGFW